ncbi:hypothetical protein CsSME_00035986 [Camellia sinensis var. sinensis]
MGQSVEMGTIRAGDFMRLFCSNLGVNNKAVKVAQEAVQKRDNQKFIQGFLSPYFKDNTKQVCQGERPKEPLQSMN